MLHKFIVEPDWQPFETVPKDGRDVCLLYFSVDFETGEPRQRFSNYYWGLMTAYPDHGKMWIPSKERDNPDNNSHWNAARAFEKEIFIYNDHRTRREHVLYRGGCFAAWAEPWETEIIVKTPPTVIPLLLDVIKHNDYSV